MRKRTGVGIAAILLLVSFLLVALVRGNHVLDFGLFRIETSLYLICILFFVLGAFLVSLLSMLFQPSEPPMKWSHRAFAPASSAHHHRHDQEAAAPGGGGAPTCRAQVLAQFGDYDAAEALLAKVPNTSPDFWYAQKIRADLELQRGSWVKAEMMYRQALRLSPDPKSRGLIVMTLAEIYDIQHMGDRARELYMEVINLLPLAPEPVLRLRHAAIQERDWTEAMRWQEHLEDRLPDVADRGQEWTVAAGVRYQLAEQELQRGAVKTAQALLKSIFRMTDTFVPAYLLSGDVYEKQEDGPGAIRAWARGFASTRNPALLERIAGYYLLHNMPGKAIEAYHNNLLDLRDSLFLEYWLGELYFQLEMMEDAVRIFQRIHSLMPGWLINSRRLAEALIKSGCSEEGAQVFEEILDRAAGDPLLPWKCESCGTHYEDYRSLCTECLEWNTVQPDQPQAGPVDLHNDEELPAIPY